MGRRRFRSYCAISSRRRARALIIKKSVVCNSDALLRQWMGALCVLVSRPGSFRSGAACAGCPPSPIWGIVGPSSVHGTLGMSPVARSGGVALQAADVDTISNEDGDAASWAARRKEKKKGGKKKSGDGGREK